MWSKLLGRWNFRWDPCLTWMVSVGFRPGKLQTSSLRDCTTSDRKSFMGLLFGSLLETGSNYEILWECQATGDPIRSPFSPYAVRLHSPTKDFQDPVPVFCCARHSSTGSSGCLQHVLIVTSQKDQSVRHAPAVNAGSILCSPFSSAPSTAPTSRDGQHVGMEGWGALGRQKT